MSRKKGTIPSPNTKEEKKWEMLKKNFNVFWVISLILLFVTGFLLSYYGHWIVASIVLGIFFIALCLVDHFIVKKDSLTRITAGLACFTSILAGGYFNNTQIALSQQPYLSIAGSEVPSSPSSSFHDEGFNKSLALKSTEDEMDSGAPPDTVGLDSETKLLKTLIWGYKRAETERTKRYILEKVESIEPSSARSASMISYFYYETDQFDKAIDYLLHAFDFPDSEDGLFTLYYRLCLSYLGKKDYEKAAYYCDRAIDCKGAKNQLISLYALRADCIPDRYRKREYIAKALAIKPSTAEDYFIRGVMFDETHQRDSSVANFTEAINHDPDNGKYYYFRGLKFYYDCDPQLAYEDLLLANSLGYEEGRVCFWIGMSLLACSNEVEASAYFTRAIQSDKENWMGYFWRGIANLICNDQSSAEIAVRDFNTLTDNGINFQDLLLFSSEAKLKADVRGWSEDRDNWRLSILDSMALDADNIPSWWSGYCSWNVLYRLIDLYSSFLIKPYAGGDSSKYLCRIGTIYYYMYDFRKAKQAFSKAIKYSDYKLVMGIPDLFPEVCREAADLYNNRSIAERQLWMFRRKALRDVTKAISIEPGVDYLYTSRANLYARRGKYDKVVEDYKMAAQIDSSRSDYFYEIGTGYYFMKDYDNAIPWFEKALQIDSTDQGSKEQLYSIRLSKALEEGRAFFKKNKRRLRRKDIDGLPESLPESLPELPLPE